MRRSDFYFELPEQLIAQYPLDERRASRLLCLDAGQNAGQDQIQDKMFADLPGMLRKGDLLVFNDTRVIPARLLGHKETGGRLEVLVERLLDEQTLIGQVRASKAPAPGCRLYFDSDITAIIEQRQGVFYRLRFDNQRPLSELLQQIGHIPLPPYINRQDEKLDRQRYQTVYARHPGAVAAPTAGLHFDEALIQQLSQQGVELAYVTLHVAAGTFQPVRVDNIHEHIMHHETIDVSAQVCQQVQACRERGGRIIAVGTTVVRSLETAAQAGDLQPYHGDTNIFITPGYQFKVIDALITNFHVPESTLLMLVCALAGTEPVLAAYRHAVAEQYRFFSYGDAMFIGRHNTPATHYNRRSHES